jgi:hypothetical protein
MIQNKKKKPEKSSKRLQGDPEDEPLTYQGPEGPASPAPLAPQALDTPPPSVSLELTSPVSPEPMPTDPPEPVLPQTSTTLQKLSPHLG